MRDEMLLEVLSEAALAVSSALATIDDLRPAGDRPGQYRLDLVADAAALEVLHRAGLSVLSEESGLSPPGPGPSPGDKLLAVIDPVDGSTNASLGIPWYATSICVLDAEGPRVALVVNQANGARYDAIRGGGARRDGHEIAPSGCREASKAVVGISGFPKERPGWAQFRALGAAALDICAVAEGVLDGYRVVGGSWLNSWDYLGALLVCTESGAVVGELNGDVLEVRDASRRAPVAAATPELFESLLSYRG